MRRLHRTIVLVVGLIASAFFAPGRSAAFTETFTSNASTTPWSASASADVTVSAAAGDTICIAFGVESSSKTLASPPVTDDGGTSYSLAVQNLYAAVPLYSYAYCGVATTTVTVGHAAFTASFATVGHVVAWVITGARATAPVGNTNTQQDATGTTHTSNAVAITDATAVMLGVARGSGTEVYTNEVGWTERRNLSTLLCADKEVSASETWDYTSATNATVNTMVWEIRPAAAAGASGGGALLNMFRGRLQVNP